MKVMNKKNSKPSIKDYNCQKTTSHELKSQLAPLEKESSFVAETVMGFVGTFVTLFLIIKKIGLFDLWLFLPIIGGSFLFSFVIVGLAKNLIARILNPELILEEIRSEETRQFLKKEIEKRTAYESALEKWDYYNLITKNGYWYEKKGIALEHSISNILLENGWNAKLTNKTGDGGIDLICDRNGIKVLIQAKGHSKPLGVSAIRDAAGVKMTEKPDYMVVICPRGFTKGSIDFAKRSKIILADASNLVAVAKGEREIFSN